MRRLVVIEAQGVVYILGDPAPAAVVGTGAPHHIVVAGEVQVAEVDVHRHDVEILLPVDPLDILLEGVALLLVEGSEGVVEVAGALFQFAVLGEVDVFQPVVGGDVDLVGAFADVEDAVVLAVDIDDGGLPGLPVDASVLGHAALADGVAHIEAVAVVAGIAEHDGLEVCHSRLLVGEELMVEGLRAEALVGIEDHRLAGSVS